MACSAKPPTAPSTAEPVNSVVMSQPSPKRMRNIRHAAYSTQWESMRTSELVSMPVRRARTTSTSSQLTKRTSRIEAQADAMNSAQVPSVCPPTMGPSKTAPTSPSDEASTAIAR